MDEFSLFRCDDFELDLEAGSLAMHYSLHGPSEPLRFTERVTLELPSQRLSDETMAAAHDVARLLHVVAGVSYFKVAAPPVVEHAQPLTTAEQALVRGIYRDGLHEFAYVNDLPRVLRTSVEGPVVETPRLRQPALDERRPLVAIGGGKDSTVSIELLKAAGFDAVGYATNPNRVITATAETAGIALLSTRRALDPRLFELNAEGALNGHVPVTAVNSLLAVLVSVLYGTGPVVMSNERSASDGNLQWAGVTVNHQWSKSLEAEELLRAALASRLSDGHERYFSLLRGLNELQIAGRYAPLAQYDGVLTSCNRAFTRAAGPDARWCRDCPKCRFVFLALAPFVPRERLVAIFGGDVLADPTQVPGYRQLLGIEDFKPLECVGELAESRGALAHLAADPQWHDATVVRALAADVADDAALWEPLLAQNGPSDVPAPYAKVVDEPLSTGR